LPRTRDRGLIKSRVDVNAFPHVISQLPVVRGTRDSASVLLRRRVGVRGRPVMEGNTSATESWVSLCGPRRVLARRCFEQEFLNGYIIVPARPIDVLGLR
jgi:hypothetical protein